MVEGIGAVASIEALYQIYNSVVVIVEIVQIVDSIVVVVLGLSLLKEEAVSGIKIEGCWIRYLAVE